MRIYSNTCKNKTFGRHSPVVGDTFVAVTGTWFDSRAYNLFMFFNSHELEKRKLKIHKLTLRRLLESPVNT